MGILYVVGIGPGNRENMTVRAQNVLEACDVIVGYTVYVDLVRDLFPGKEFIATPMTKEAERCRAALQKARSGKNTALICSGDSGIYGMAALVCQIRGESAHPRVEVVPGLTSAVSGGALLGAPLTHDFAVISLSDRLTPWETIEKRLRAAAEADFSIVLYNPSSRTRPGHLKKACRILAERIPNSRICGIASNIGRKGETARVLTFEELQNTETDMFCTIFIGNAQTQLIGGRMITPRGYQDR